MIKFLTVRKEHATVTLYPAYSTTEPVEPLALIYLEVTATNAIRIAKRGTANGQ